MKIIKQLLIFLKILPQPYKKQKAFYTKTYIEDGTCIKLNCKDCKHSFEEVKIWPKDPKYGKSFIPIGNDNWYATYRDLYRCTKCGSEYITEFVALI